jgi:transglutaminase-like putative cysteine protease
MRLASTPSFCAFIEYAPSGKAQVWDTLRRMREIIKQSRVDPNVIRAAVAITHTTPERDSVSQIRALHEYVRDQIRYVLDVHQVETLADPATTLRRRVGDCDDQATLLCSMAESIGYPSRLVVAGYSDASSFEHVYCQLLGDGIWWDCDPTERGLNFGEAPEMPLALFIEPV